MGHGTYIGTHRTAPVSFVTDCKNYATNCKSDDSACKFCQLLQSVTVTRTAIWLTITRGGQLKSNTVRPGGGGKWLKTEISDSSQLPGAYWWGGGGCDWKRITGTTEIHCNLNIVDDISLGNYEWIITILPTSWMSLSASRFFKTHKGLIAVAGSFISLQNRTSDRGTSRNIIDKSAQSKYYRLEHVFSGDVLGSHHNFQWIQSNENCTTKRCIPSRFILAIYCDGSCVRLLTRFWQLGVTNIP